MMKKILQFALAVLLCQAAGIIGTFFTIEAIPNWYTALNKPSFNPPSWLFGPVWIGLYTLMGIALFIIWRQGREKRGVKEALIFFMTQLVLNAAWTPLFFGLKIPGVAFAEIVLLWIIIVLTLVRFYKLSKTAGLLLVPYILWVSFAAVLNYSIWTLNLN